MTRAVPFGTLTLGARPCVIAAGGAAEVDALLATTDANAIELRADLFPAPGVDATVAALTRLRTTGRPLLLTVRAAHEGGQPVADAVRAKIYREGLALVDGIDIELSSEQLRTDLVPQARTAGKTIVLSFHDFQATPPPATLRDIATRALDAGADVAKLATTARSLDDVQSLLALTLEFRERGIATLAMGAVGALSRVFFSAAGSLLTYGSVGAPTAPGQLPIRELAGLVRRFFPTA